VARNKSNTQQPNKGSLNRVLLVAGLLLVAVTAWTFWSGRNTSTEIEKSDVIGTEIGDRAPEFSMVTLEGNTYNLRDSEGKPTIVFFMAYWCGTCIPEARALNQVREEFGDNIDIILVDIDPTSTPEFLAAFKQAAGDGDFIWGFDQGQEITNSYRVRALDTTLILDVEGYVVFKDERPTTYETFTQALSELGL